MNEKTRTLQRRLYLAAALFLLAGLGSAVAIYLNAGDTADTDMVDAFLQSKTFRHEVEAYGGKASVVADELARWFDSLWHGQTLAFTVAALAVLAAGGIFLGARCLLPDDASGEPEEDPRKDA
jgi:hypothetical protein